jgi:predicted DNA-binding ribbon-helix-helix protein
LVQSIQETPRPAHVVVLASEKECFGEIYLSSAHRDSAYQVLGWTCCYPPIVARYFVARTVPNHVRRTVALGDALMKSSIVKRSIVIHGHKTSVSLEDAFWNGLKDIAHAECVTLSKMIAEIDKNRRLGNLSSALRLFVL